ncbi:MAG: polysaccharide deacetylase family protein [Pirellulales bacterium]
MSLKLCRTDRRDFLADAARTTVAGTTACLATAAPLAADEKRPQHAQIAITLDLEMSRNFPTWDQTHWDYEKGNLNEETKRYTLEAARRVKAAGGVVHCFVVGQVFEQQDVDWLKQLVQAGHKVGNHTYDHVNVKATDLADVQFRFRRAPWLVDGRQPADVIRENIRLTNVALKTRIGIDPAGFRTPGGFNNGLVDRADVQRMLLDQGFRWVSSLYPAHPLGEPGKEPSADVRNQIVAAIEKAQPSVYPSGLVEVPMSPISDISAFRGGRWKLPWFLDTIRQGVQWSVDHRAVFDFLGHPSCLYVMDPEYRTVDLICKLVKEAGDRAEFADLDAIAKGAGA